MTEAVLFSYARGVFTRAPSGRDRPAVAAERWIAVNADANETADLSPIALAPEDELARFSSYLPRIPLVILQFPTFADGRAYSQARGLRERYGFTADLRATGEVLADQIPLMVRCGFTSFVVSHVPTIQALETGDIAEVSIFMQPIADRDETNPSKRPWLRISHFAST